MSERMVAGWSGNRVRRAKSSLASFRASRSFVAAVRLRGRKMSTRHLRRVAGASVPWEGTGDTDTEDDEDEPPVKAKTSAFAGLLDDDDEDDDADSDENNSQIVKSFCPSGPSHGSSATPSSNKERRAQQKKSAANDEDEETLRRPAAPPPPSASAPEPPPPPEPWRLSAVHIDVSNEQARLFGRQAMREAADAERRERQQQPQQPGRQQRENYAATAARLREKGSGGGRGRLIKPRDTWPPLTGGLGMEIDHDAVRSSRLALGANAPIPQHFAFTYSGHYKRSQSELEDAVELGDPRALQGLLAEHPYQVEGLLRLSEYLMLAGQLELSSEHNERCLYACEQALHPMCRLLDGTVRLQYDHPPNRPFFISLFRQMVSVGRKGCPRTALELGRLLFSLDPINDPMHSLLHLDFYALRASEAAAAGGSGGGTSSTDDECLHWLLQLPAIQLPSHSLSLYPNYAYSLALARKRMHERLKSRDRRMNESESERSAHVKEEAAAEEAARKAIRTALLLFPAMLSMLIGDGDQQRLVERWNQVHGPSASDSQCGVTLRKLLRLYVAKSGSLWEGRTAKDWLVSEARSLCAILDRVLFARQRAKADEKRPQAAADDAEAVEIGRMWSDLMTIREHEYGPASASYTFDEFRSADIADFKPTPPDALPAEHLEQLEAAEDLGGAPRQWVRVQRRQVMNAQQRAEMGRLVVPREEWMELDTRNTHPLLLFFYSLLPWAVAPRRGAR